MRTKEKIENAGAVLPLGRRDFLVLSSAAAVGLAATNVQSEVLNLGAAPMPMLSVGYWNGSLDELKAESEGPSRRRVVDASKLVAADGSLSDGLARITVHGFWRPGNQATPLSFAMRAYYPALDAATGERASAIAWSWTHNARVSNTGRFVAPVGETLDVAFERGGNTESAAPRRIKQFLGLAAQATRRTEPVTMTSRTFAQGPKLRRGVYFVALAETDRDRVPSWGSIAVQPGPSAIDAKSNGPLRISTLGGFEPARFSYVVLSVDRA